MASDFFRGFWSQILLGILFRALVGFYVWLVFSLPLLFD